MRLLRSVRLPTEMGLHHKFQSYREIQTSTSLKNLVLVDRPVLASRPEMGWRWKSNVAFVASNIDEGRKSRARVSKSDRKSMVESFVKKYREMNCGKFPTTSDVMKELGGSYYFVREIIQEIEYKCSRPSMDANHHPTAVDVSQTAFPREHLPSTRKVDIKPSRTRGHDPKKLPRHPIAVEHDKSKGAGTQPCHCTDEPASLSSENKATIKISHASRLASREYDPKHMIEESDESEVSKRDLDQLQGEVAEPQKKFSVWQSLKSFLGL